MGPCDAVKLVYQRVLGGGHLIADPAASLARLRAEYASVSQCSGPLWEELGGGVVRVHLSRLETHGVPVKDLNQWFVRSAEELRGSRAELMDGLAELRRATRAGLLPFPEAALEDYLAGYAAAGYPAVSHSVRYRAAYAPAYRVGLSALLPAEWGKIS